MAHVTPLRARRIAFPVAASLAILVCSIALGVAFRAAMRAAALIDGLPPEFHLGVSLTLAGLAALLGVGLAVLFVLIGAGFPSSSWTRKGRVFALIVFVCPTLPFLILDPQMHEIGNKVTSWLIFGSLLPLFALSLGALLDVLDPRPDA